MLPKNVVKDLLEMAKIMGTPMPNNLQPDDVNTNAADDMLVVTAADSGFHSIDLSPENQDVNSIKPGDSGVYTVYQGGRGITDFKLLKAVGIFVQSSYGKVQLDPLDDKERFALIEQYVLGALLVASFREDRMQRFSLITRAHLTIDVKVLASYGVVRRNTQPYPGFLRYRSNRQMNEESMRHLAQTLDDQMP